MPDDRTARIGEVIRTLRALCIRGDEAKLVRLVRNLPQPEAVSLLDLIGMDRWDEDARGVVEKSPKEWKAMAPWARALCRALPLAVHAELLLRASPQQYKEPRLPNRAMKARTSKESADAMELRRRKHQRLRHPEDDVEILDQGKKFVGTLFEHEEQETRSPKRAHRTHFDWRTLDR
jgi:hypothetical protein